MLVALGKQNEEGDWNEDEGNVGKKTRGGGVCITCTFYLSLMFMNVHEH